MTHNILITGAAGYIPAPKFLIKIFTLPRGDDQIQALSKLGVNTVKLNLSNDADVRDTILRNNITFVVHTASSNLVNQASSLITALGERRKATGEKVFFIHSSIVNVFTSEGGWPHGPLKDTDDFYEREKQLDEAQPGHQVRHNNVTIPELTEKHDVTFIDVVVPNVYGTGTGQWRKLSVNLPSYIRTSMRLREVHQFERDALYKYVHVSDLAKLYVLLIEKALQGVSIPTGKNGHYFAVGHQAESWKLMRALNDEMYKRKLVDKPEPKIWLSYGTAAKELGFPAMYIKAIGIAKVEVIPVNAYQLGWKPEWDERRFFENIEDEIQAVLDMDTFKPSLFETFE